METVPMFLLLVLKQNQLWKKESFLLKNKSRFIASPCYLIPEVILSGAATKTFSAYPNYLIIPD